ncbi:hypothetical protein GCM10009785_01450 [Brooklawnia cerclae]|uniref:Uncharacterized protein n=1 Tax=Brooklawnia cerclae TaxID=349934 RepID=A0ABX0SE17_9ACTN|nr:hypothetical protein [Brooklawnia cerclae]NIH56260.1 hypothetical protein [Brooklawnia cerclae]
MSFEFGKSKPGKQAGFMRPAASVPDPLSDIEYTGNVETDSATELDALAQGFRSRRNQEEKRFRNATDSEYWFAVCFRDRAAKDRFLAAINATRLGDKYVDGHALARLLGIDIDA